jgi:murein L,D-transpeptidase YafK
VSVPLRLRAGARIGARVAVVAFAMSATALADGSLIALPSAPALANHLEAALVRSIVDLRAAALKSALAQIDQVVAARPDFRLAQLVKGDILMAKAGRPVAFASNAFPAQEVAPLQDEARARLRRYLDAPPVDELPESLLQLAPNQPYALVVDTSRSRLYVYANDLGTPRYVTDFYISLGRYGVEKEREGDQKTPIGVYTIVSEKEKVPDLYGPRAFPLSYPNDWDRMHGRKGHGIWLHGTMSATYSRPPWATDGCVVLTNDDLARLTKYVDVSRTPVVIGQSVRWLDRRAWQGDRESFLDAFGAWRKDWESRDTGRYLSHYSSRFRSDSGDLAAWKARKREVNAAKSWIKVGVDELSLFTYPGTQGMVMATFVQDYRSSNLSNRTVKRQYWIREAGHWRILHESVVS